MFLILIRKNVARKYLKKKSLRDVHSQLREKSAGSRRNAEYQKYTLTNYFFFFFLLVFVVVSEV